METEFFIAYCSPAGSTKHVADVIRNQLLQLNDMVYLLDLGADKDWSEFIKQIESRIRNDKQLCLFIGSPVYISRCIPPVMEFIELLPNVTSGYAVPFITWGGGTSGIALWEMGKALIEKGYKIVGAAKVLAVHSILWEVGDAIGGGRPNAADDRIIIDMVKNLDVNLKNKKINPIDIDVLDYLPVGRKDVIKSKDFVTSKQRLPIKEVDETKCTQCGECQDNCPVDAIDLNPYPQFKEGCICCFNCKRLCPEHAINAGLSALIERLKKRMSESYDKPYTRVFMNNST
jgi:NAD-dependent dihydropyrimidine dehydrogenase PreA subunit